MQNCQTLQFHRLFVGCLRNIFQTVKASLIANLQEIISLRHRPPCLESIQSEPISTALSSVKSEVFTDGSVSRQLPRSGIADKRARGLITNRQATPFICPGNSV